VCITVIRKRHHNTNVCVLVLGERIYVYAVHSTTASNKD